MDAVSANKYPEIESALNTCDGSVFDCTTVLGKHNIFNTGNSSKGDLHAKPYHRSEYWKSQPRKFCDFCKCWITDNKPSIDFHEKGKRHKEAVKQKIDDLRKKGVADEKKRQKENDYMQRMEKAALAAFKKDLAENPELAKQYNVKQPEVFEGPQLPEGYVPSKSSEADEEKEESKEEKQGEWYEAMSEMGYPYYWNTVTGESLWVAPEKYVALADQGLEPAPPAENQEQEKQEEQTEPKAVEDIPLPPGIEAIPLPGEADPPSPPSPEESESEEEETVDGKQDRSSRGVYGIWSRVQQEAEQEQIDLELPKTDYNYEPIAIPVPTEEVKVKFKEKRVTSLGSNKSGPVAFKKRKLAGGARNVRKRDDSDD